MTWRRLQPAAFVRGDRRLKPAPRRTALEMTALRFARFRFVDLQDLTVDVTSVETGDRLAGVVTIAELDEAETLRLTAVALGGNIRRDDRPERSRHLVELRVVDLLGEIAYIEFHLRLLPAVPAFSPVADGAPRRRSSPADALRVTGESLRRVSPEDLT